MTKLDESKKSTAQAQSQQQQQQHDPDWAPKPQAHSQYNRKEKNSNGEDEEDEEDEYEKRIERTGCSAENEALQMCYAEKHDWRACKDAMTAFRECWKRNGNVEAE
ncbi:hypothetical protein BGZ76_000672 [Entomortierella beljakovae]|nr:hypothetical protein BGZ76_000672 [Entomortierella beljakovae]